MVDLVKLLPFAAVLALPGGSVAIPICLRWAPGLLPSTFVKKPNTNTPNVVAIKTHISNSIQGRVKSMVEDLNMKQDREEELEKLFVHLQERAAAGKEVDWSLVAKPFTENRVSG